MKYLETVIDQLDLGLVIQDSSSKFMKSLVGDLLDFAQLQKGKFRKDEHMFNIRKCLKETIAIQEYKAQKRGIVIKTIFENFESHNMII